MNLNFKKLSTDEPLEQKPVLLTDGKEYVTAQGFKIDGEWYWSPSGVNIIEHEGLSFTPSHWAYLEKLAQ